MDLNTILVVRYISLAMVLKSYFALEYIDSDYSNNSNITLREYPHHQMYDLIFAVKCKFVCDYFLRF